ESDEDDGDFTESSSDTDSQFESEDSDDIEITHEELADSLPSKTIPLRNRRRTSTTAKSKGKRVAKQSKKRRHANTGLPGTAQPSQSEVFRTTVQNAAKKKVCLIFVILLYIAWLISDQVSGKRNPIYLFYEEVLVNEKGEVGKEGDKHYKCYHGNRATFTISKAMNYSLNGLTGHLKSTFKPMYQLYLVLYARSRDGIQPTPEEVLYASGQQAFDPSIHAEYIQKLDAQAAGIKEAFAKQQAKAAEPWDQEKFEQLLIQWIAACDQPFEEVEKPEFIAMMEYGRDPTKFSLPKKDGVRRRVMKLGEKTIAETRDLSAVSFSLDLFFSEPKVCGFF
ncbi:hypothetical protein FPV67DRAFT_1412468, partial [Lyophyllum atratum]